MTFSTKVDTWIAALVGGSYLMMVGLGLWMLESNPTAAKITLAAALFNGLVLALVGIPCRYRVSSDALTVSSGLFIRKTIPITDIGALEPKRSFISAPAWSADRVHIMAHDGRLLAIVSPKDQQGFLRYLQDCMGR